MEVMVHVLLPVSYWTGAEIVNSTCPTDETAKCTAITGGNIGSQVSLPYVLYWRVLGGSSRVCFTLKFAGTDSTTTSWLLSHIYVALQIKLFISSKRDCRGGSTAHCTQDQPCTPCELDQLVVSPVRYTCTSPKRLHQSWHCIFHHAYFFKLF